jgi:hypothetical protein
MVNYLQIEELPKNYQHYIRQLNKIGFDDIRSIYFYDRGDFNFTIWLDVEDMVDGKVKNANYLRPNLRVMVNPDYFGVADVNYRIRYKNKQAFANKILPDLKKELKSSEYSQFISSIRFDVNDDIEEPIVRVILKKKSGLNLTYDSVNKIYREIHDILDQYKKKNGLKNLDTRVV